MSPARGNRGLLLSECQETGLLVRVRCNFCRKGERLYEPNEVAQLVGDRELHSLSGRLRCEDCGRRDWTDVNRIWRFEAVRQGLSVRRLERIEIVRRPIWRDERL